MANKITISDKSGASVNWIADYILTEKADLVSRLPELEFIEGAARVFGSGDNAVLEIVIRYENISKEDLESIEKILKWAKVSADNVIMVYEED